MIHSFQINALNIVLDVGSGSVHVVDEETAAVLKKLEKVEFDLLDLPKLLEGTPPDITKAILALTENGSLFSPVPKIEQENSIRQVKALCLHMAHECNLSCIYCFAGQGHYSDPDRGLMSFDVGKKAIDFLIASSGNRRNLEIDFFGGEPTLNMDVVKELVLYSKSIENENSKNFRFTLTTNGTLLDDEIINFANEYMDNVVISLDGRKETNDKHRTFLDGSGSYEDLLPRLIDFAKKTKTKYYVRGTFTKYNLDFSKDVIHLMDVGFKNISVEPVVASAEAEYGITESDLPAIMNEYEHLAIIMENREEKFFHFEIDLDGGPCLIKKITGCGAGSDYLAVTPKGKLYPCHQFVSDEKFIVGDVNTGINSTDIVKEFAGCNIFKKPECMSCWAMYYCSGGCMATAYNMNGSIFKPDYVSCEMQKKRIECALYIYAARQLARS